MTKTVVFAEEVAAVTLRKPSIFRQLLDGWITQEDAVAESIYRPVTRNRPGNSLIGVLRDQADLDVIGSCSIITDIGFPGQEFLRQYLIPACRDAQRMRRPVSSKQLIAADGLRISVEWLLLPDRMRETADWCVAYVEIGFLLRPVDASPIFDDMDRNLLQALMEGYTVKEIALQVGLSHRTVEHRFERLKARIGARSLSHLVALLIATELATLPFSAERQAADVEINRSPSVL